MDKEIAEVLIPEAIVTVTGTTTVSPTHTLDTVPKAVLIEKFAVTDKVKALDVTGAPQPPVTITRY
jgi:hypothetical protein